MSSRYGFPAVVLLVGLLGLTTTRLRAETGWYPQTSPVTANLSSVDFVDAQNGWICGANGTILSTRNGGQQWISRASGTALDLAEIDFCDADNGYCAGVQGLLLRTTDGGVNWETVLEPYYQNPPLAVSVLDPLSVWISCAGGIPNSYSTGASLSTDGGATWHDWGFSWNDGHQCYLGAYDVAGISLESVFLSVTVQRYDYSTYGLIFRSTDGGETFQNVEGAGGGLRQVEFANPQVGFGGPNGELHRTTNGGNTWTMISLPNYRQMSFVSADRGWIIGSAGLIAETTDGGTTWTPQASGTTTELADIQFVNPSVGTAVGANGIILHTVTGGRTGAAVAQEVAGCALRLLPSAPNPFARSVQIGYLVPQASPVQLSVFDVSGRAVRMLESSFASEGRHVVTWNGTDAEGRAVPPGVYFVRLSGPSGEQQQAVTIVR